MAPDGSGILQLTNDAFKDRGAAFMPDGRRIVFYSDRGGHYDLWSIDRDGSGLRRLTTTEGRYWPVPSPDGSRMVAADINTIQLYVYDASDFSKPPEVLPEFPAELRGVVFIPSHWSPDGKTLVGVSNPQLWTYSFDSKQYRRVSDSGSALVRWLPDSRRLLYVQRGRVVVVDAFGSSPPRDVFSIPGEGISVAVPGTDGWLYFLSGSASGDVWTIRFGDQDAARPQP